MNGRTARWDMAATRLLIAIAVAAALWARLCRSRHLAHQGPRQCRRRAGQPAHRLWPRGQAQRHRRHDQQPARHPASPITAMLERLGVNIRGRAHNLKNVAAVMVTGNLPAFSTQGTRMDVTVSALGDAKNLDVGTLLVTPLLGADGNVYARSPRGRSRSPQSVCRPRSGREHHAGRADRRPHRQWGDHRVRNRFRPQSPDPAAPGAAQRRFHHGQAHRRRHQ